jgi:hypothetical protein
MEHLTLDHIIHGTWAINLPRDVSSKTNIRGHFGQGNIVLASPSSVPKLNKVICADLCLGDDM